MYLQYISCIFELYLMNIRALLGISQEYLSSGICQAFLDYFSSTPVAHVRNISSCIKHITGLSNTQFRRFVSICKAYFRLMVAYHHRNDINQLIIIRILSTLMHTEIFAAYAGSCLFSCIKGSDIFLKLPASKLNPLKN